MNHESDTGERMVFVLMRCALACIVIAILGGALSVVFYIKGVASFLGSIGVHFQNLRPVHTTFASAWIFLGGITCVHHFLFTETGDPTDGDRRRYRFQMVCWGLAGAGILLSLLLGVSSGREYMGFHPAFSILIVAGWLCFAWTFFSRVRRGFWARPVYVYMWATGILYFLYTFTEGHAYLLPGVRDYPVVDLQIQWKHCGTVVASFNMLVYGSLMYLGERLSGDRSYARSTKGFVFLGIGMLNSFTNYAHHTYHLPQDHVIKWIAFIVSMLEIAILASIFNDLRRSIAKSSPTDNFVPAARYVTIGKYWSFGLLGLALLISVPQANSFIHGTRVVMAHAMGSEIGIDSFVLFAFFAWIISETYTRCWTTQAWLGRDAARRLVDRVNLSLLGLFLCLLLDGAIVGVTRAFSVPAPEWLTRLSPVALVALGTLHGWFLLRVVAAWWPFLGARAERRLAETDVFPSYPLTPPRERARAE